MGTALQIEMALDQAKTFEADLQILFMQAGKIDVWNKIKARAQAMDVEDAHTARREKEEEKKRKQKEQEQLEFGLMLGGLAILLFMLYVGIYEVMEHCAKVRCGR
jgi:hypothetical protein